MSRQLALIIGNSEYDDQYLGQLSTPEADVAGLAQVLENPEIGGFESVVWMLNETASVVRREISRFLTHRKQRDDLLLLYFSGHGVLDEQGRLYLAAWDTEKDLLQATAVSAAFIEEELDRSHSRRQVFILDCCHSGAFTRGTKGAVGSSVGTKNAFAGNGYGRVVLTATDATQYAWEGEELQGQAETSVFTHYLIQGLETGKADLNEDGLISLDELYDYTYDQIVRVNARQIPHKWSYLQEGDLIIARNPRFTAGRDLPLAVLRTLDSGHPWEREGAIIELGHIQQGNDPSMAAAAGELLRRLSQGKDPRLAAAATRQLQSLIEANPLLLTSSVSLFQGIPLEFTQETLSDPPATPSDQTMLSRSNELPISPASSLTRTLPVGHGLIQEVDLAPDFSQVAAATSSGIWLLNSEDLRPVQRLVVPTGYPLCLAWSPDGTQIAAGSSDSAVFIWDASGGRLQRTLEGHASAILSVAWHPGSRQLASGSQDGALRLWQAGIKNERLVIEAHRGGVLGVDWSPDGRRVATAGTDGRVILWDAESGRPLTRLEEHQGRVNVVAWSPDGKRLASGGDDHTIRIWDANGQALRVLARHTQPVQALDWSPDGRRLASAGDDGTLRVWDTSEMRSLRLLTPLLRRRGTLVCQLALAWSDSSSHFISGGSDGIIRLWSAISGKELVEFSTLVPETGEERPALTTLLITPQQSLEAIPPVATTPEVEDSFLDEAASEGEAVGPESPGDRESLDGPTERPQTVQRTFLRSLLVERFSLSELHDLSFDLGVDFENLHGDTKADKARGLMEHLERRGRLQELLEVGARQRPDIDWRQFDGLDDLDHPVAD